MGNMVRLRMFWFRIGMQGFRLGCRETLLGRIANRIAVWWSIRGGYIEIFREH